MLARPHHRHHHTRRDDEDRTCPHRRHHPVALRSKGASVLGLLLDFDADHAGAVTWTLELGLLLDLDATERVHPQRDLRPEDERAAAV